MSSYLQSHKIIIASKHWTAPCGVRKYCAVCFIHCMDFNLLARSKNMGDYVCLTMLTILSSHYLCMIWLQTSKFVFRGRYARNVPQSLQNHSFSVALTESDSVEVPEWKGIC